MKSSDGLIELKARQAVVNADRHIDLTLTVYNPEQVRLECSYRVDLPNNVSFLPLSRSPLEHTTMIPDGGNEQFGWVVELGRQVGVEREIVVRVDLAFTGLHTTTTGLRAALSQLLKERQ